MKTIIPKLPLYPLSTDASRNEPADRKFRCSRHMCPTFHVFHDHLLNSPHLPSDQSAYVSQRPVKSDKLELEGGPITVLIFSTQPATAVRRVSNPLSFIILDIPPEFGFAVFIFRFKSLFVSVHIRNIMSDAIPFFLGKRRPPRPPRPSPSFENAELSGCKLEHLRIKKTMPR